MMLIDWVLFFGWMGLVVFAWSDYGNRKTGEWGQKLKMTVEQRAEIRRSVPVRHEKKSRL